MKYIIYEGAAPYSGGMEPCELAIVFGEDQTHSIIAKGLHNPSGRRRAKIISAGFFYTGPGKIWTEGKSDSLKIESRPLDYQIIVDCYPTFSSQ